MADSILDSTKKALQLTADYDVFDPDIIMHINSTLATLNQIGIGTPGFMIEDADATWDLFLGTDPMLSMAKSYVYFKVRMAFDPPSTSYHINALESQIKEYEWRLSTYREVSLASVAIPGSDFLPSDTIDGGGA